MLKRSTAILLIILLIATGFQRLVAYAAFELNKEYVVQKLCINRDKPWLHCNGKCYFMRKLKAAQENERKQGVKNMANHMVVSFIHQWCSVVVAKRSSADLALGVLPGYSSLYKYVYSASLLQPPRLKA